MATDPQKKLGAVDEVVVIPEITHPAKLAVPRSAARRLAAAKPFGDLDSGA
jgi:hypothetical protein